MLLLLLLFIFVVLFGGGELKKDSSVVFVFIWSAFGFLAFGFGGFLFLVKNYYYTDIKTVFCGAV